MSEDREFHKPERRQPLLGCIADDLTGATDIAGTLVSNGMSATVELGLPRCEAAASDAIVIGLKSRSAPVQDAVNSSVDALRWLRSQGCLQFFFKYCSTFDSTPQGNIGPVAEALMEELGAKFTIACPAFPANRRTVYNGYLFVGDVLLEETSMRAHPLTPMTDSNLVRILQAQCKRKVGLIGSAVVREGSFAIARAIKDAEAGGTAVAIVDAVSNSDLRQIAEASRELVLLTGASGLASGIPETFRRQGMLHSHAEPDYLAPVAGFSAIFCGSCSDSTQRQVKWVSQKIPTVHLDPEALATNPECVAEVVEWARARISQGPVLISSTADASAVKAVQGRLGMDRAGALVERRLGEIAQQLVAGGVRRLIVAGGETSGTILAALGVTRMRIGSCIDPGVHWAVSEGEVRLALALKSGNFGSEDFFQKAWGVMP